MRLPALLLLAALPLLPAEVNWPEMERYATDLLQRYLRIPSINPPADTREAAALIKAEFERHGFAATLYTSGPAGQTNLLVRVPGRDRTKRPLLLLNHFDVVPVDRAAWPVDPFGAMIQDGWLWGRGVLDMKAIGVQQMIALIAMKQAGLVPARDIVMLCTADEESSGVYGVQWMAKNHPREIDAEFALDEGGVASRDLFTPSKLVFGVSVGEKQIAWLRIRAKGTAAHGSQPIAENANLLLLEALRKALALPEASRPNEIIARMREGIGVPLADNKFISAIQRNTATLTTLRSGVGDPPKVNVIPSAAEATVDCRLLPGVNAEEFVSEMRARINDPRVTVEMTTAPNDPGPSNANTALFSALARAVAAHHPDATVTPILVPYGTDSNRLRSRGITAYGFVPMVLPAEVLATMHSDGERIPLSEFHKGLRIYFDVLRSEF